MQPSNLNDQLTKCWQAGVYPKSWQKKNEKKILEVDIDELITTIGKKLEKENLSAGQFGDLILGVSNILNSQVNHFLNRFKKSDDLKKKENAAIRIEQLRPENENIDRLDLPEVDLDDLLNIPEQDEHLLQDEIPLRNYNIVDDEGFGDLNYTEDQPQVLRDQVVDSSKGWREGPSSRQTLVKTPALRIDETESAIKSVSKSIRFEDQPEISEAPEEISDIAAGFADFTARREISELLISEIRSSPLQKSPMKQHIVTVDESQLEDHATATPSLVQSLIRKSSPRKNRSHVHEPANVVKPQKVPGKKLKEVKRYNKRGFKIYHPGKPLIDLDDLPLHGLVAEEKDIDDFYYGVWNDVLEFKGKIEAADERRYHEMLAEIYPYEPFDRSEQREASVLDVQELNEPIENVPVLEPSNVEIEVPTPALEPTTVGESLQDTTTLEEPIIDEMIPADVPALEEPIIDEIIPANLPALEEPIIDEIIPAEVPVLGEPVTDEIIPADVPADEPPTSAKSIQVAKQKKIIQRPEATAKLLELMINELENQDSVVFQDIYPERGTERNLAFYCFLYLINDGELECQQDEHMGPIIITRSVP